MVVGEMAVIMVMAVGYGTYLPRLPGLLLRPQNIHSSSTPFCIFIHIVREFSMNIHTPHSASIAFQSYVFNRHELYHPFTGPYSSSKVVPFRTS